MAKYILMMGPQGAGKGTQADLLSHAIGLPHLSMGQLLREEIASGSELGKSIEGILKSGNLVANEANVAVLEKRLSGDDAKLGVIFDGFPRSMKQLEIMDMLKERMGVDITHAIVINISEDETIRRLTTRLVCQNASCGANYNTEFLLPKTAGKCDRCGGEVTRRDDDEPDAIRNRLGIYRDQTAKVVEHYRALGVVHDVNGERPIEEVKKDIRAIVGE